MAGLILKNLCKVYEGSQQKSVDNFCLDIEDKEFIIFVGPSGCGKSTTLRMIAGLEEITSGELYIGDNLVNDVSPKNRDIAMVFQSYALYPHMTVFENMAFGLKQKKVPKAEIKRRVTEAAKILDIEHLLERKPKALSGGQRQRVALGRAIVREPKVFLMDEPLSNLDAKLRVQMRAEIGKLHQRLQTTFIYVTHDQTEAMTMGTRIVVMKDGVVQQVDTPQNLYDNPVNMFVGGFMGSPQMNMTTAKLEKEGNEYVLVFGSNKLTLPASKINDAVKEHVGKEVVFGIRSEDIHDEQSFISAFPNATIDVKVDFSELMGAETYLYLLADGNKFIARVNPRTTAKIGDSIKVGFDMEKLHLFDPETELSMTKNS